MGIGATQYADLVAAGVKNTSSLGTTYLQAAGFKTLSAVMTVITSSGTFASAAAWLEGSLDGENWWPMPLDNVIQGAASNSTAFIQIGSAGATGTTTAGFNPILLYSFGSAAGVATASDSHVGLKYSGLPNYVRAAYVVVPGIGGLNFMIRAQVTT